MKLSVEETWGAPCLVSPAMPVILLMGVCGVGKSCVGEALSAATGAPFFDADIFHPQENKEKMRAGIPLTDEDRQPWLASIAQKMREQAGAPCIFSCSALKRRYRDFLRSSVHPLHPTLVLLLASKETLLERLAARPGHFFNPSLLQSQIDTLEQPEEAEKIITLDCTYMSVAEVVEKLVEHLRA